MSYGVQAFSASSAELAGSLLPSNGIVVDVVTIPAGSGIVTYTYPAYTGCELIAFFTLSSVSLQNQSVKFSGSPPSITLSNAWYARTMYVVVSNYANAPGSEYGIYCTNDAGQLLPMQSRGGVATLIAKTSSASALDIATPYQGVWSRFWRYTVTTHEFMPIVFVVPPLSSGVGAGVWVENIGYTGGSVGSKGWNIDVGCYDNGAGGRVGPPQILVFDRRSQITSGSTYGIQTFAADGRKIFDSNDGMPLYIVGTLEYGGYTGPSPYGGALNATLPSVTTPAIQLPQNSGILATRRNQGASGYDYEESFLTFRLQAGGVVNRGGIGYDFSRTHEYEPTENTTVTQAYYLEACSLMVIDASKY